MGAIAGCPPLVAIAGPTASGKSALALAVAKALDGEVVNYDSVQVYRGFDIGSGKVPPAERGGIPHHLLDCREAEEPFTAGDYRREALRVLEDIKARTKLPVFVGGTGLYLRAVLSGLFEGPQRSEKLRSRLRRIGTVKGREFLHELLRRFDPEAAARIQPRDAQKTVRAIEVCLLARAPISKMQARGRAGLEGFQVIKVGLNPPREILYQRINRRVEQMFQSGLLDEARAMRARGNADQIKALGALGYRQASAVAEGQLSLPDAIFQTQASTRRYAKRQWTWFRSESGITWFGGFGDDPLVQDQVIAFLRREAGAVPGRASELRKTGPSVQTSDQDAC